MADMPREQARRFIARIRDAAGHETYAAWALAARERYTALRLRQDSEIRSFYLHAAKSLTEHLAAAEREGRQGEAGRLLALRTSLEDAARDMNAQLTLRFGDYLTEATEAGASYSIGIMQTLAADAGGAVAQAITTSGLQATAVRLNRAAVEACWARTINGLTLSDRLWSTSQRATTVMRDIVRESVALGNDAVETARMLQSYVRDGKRTLAANYPAMQERMSSTWPRGMTFQEAKAKGLLQPGASRVPGDVCYESLRLARTETSAAFSEGTIATARMSPSYTGMRWVISSSHPEQDVCDGYATADVGLGAGVYPPGDEPLAPSHPNCLCTLIAEHEDPDAFVERLRAWVDDPTKDAELELWHRRVYRELPEGTALKGLKLTEAEKQRAQAVGWLGSKERIITGAAAKKYESLREFLRLEQQAERHYRAIIKRTSDVPAIAKAAGLTEEEVLAIKQHIFIDTHRFEDGEERKFDPDYDVALVWRRLIAGKEIRESDLVFLRHELLERELMETGLVYEEAHKAANLRYNWVAAIAGDPED